MDDLLAPASEAGITVVVCCYNSASRLSDTLAALAGLDASAGFGVEVLVIDNASTDDTFEVATRRCAQPDFTLPHQVLLEPRSGKSNAIALGFERAAYKYVAIVDDDNWLAPDYLNIAWQILETHPEVGVLGGQGEPVGEVDPPEWFATYAVDYATGPQGEQSGDITTAKRYLYGAGQIIRKAAWQKVLQAGFQSILTGRKGAKLSSGEDNEMCYAIILAGYKIWYDARLTFKHFIPARRLRWEHVQNLYAGNANSEAELSPYLYFLLNPQAVNQPLRPLLSLRHSVSMVQYWLRYGWQTVRQGELLTPTSPRRIRAGYYWRSIWKYLARELQPKTEYEAVRQLSQRLATGKNPS